MEPVSAADLYLDLMKRVLTRSGFPEPVFVRPSGWKRRLTQPVQDVLGRRGYALVSGPRADASIWSNSFHQAETMIGLGRLDNVQECVETVITDGIPGDLIETGVWRGGASIFMRAVLAAYEVTDRIVWAADSFEGFPTQGSRRHSQDRGTDFTGGLGAEVLAVDLATVKQNFARYGLLDDQVRFLAGWFSETLPIAPIEQLAVIRLDGDMYESTWDALDVLYPKLSPGGFVIVDDYRTFAGCREAVDTYRTQHEITDPIREIDDHAVYWQRGPVEAPRP